ncbi:MAG: 2OG-Fe(II) oxygenase [Gammaproteobacteria bacterium]|nr:2OG-Fe(II) oxygenase [Gammaproteobacteria bacterium]NVK88665.1 2OG-Fe(II) oxygenase [Gammaproteobacteria bacterium]
MSEMSDIAIASQARESELFAKLAQDLCEQGYSVQLNAVDLTLCEQLFHCVHDLTPEKFTPAGIGREQQNMHNRFVRNDTICWIDGVSEAGADWLGFAERLRQFLNQQLFLGLFSFETHFAHYSPGDFYRKHRDAFKGEANRVLSVVLYLNPGWQSSDGGELVIYNDDNKELQKVLPSFATLVVFLSEEFPHEVLAAQRDRYSVTGWFRLNASSADKIDPPR